MKQSTIIPTHEDIEKLKIDIEQARRAQEYQKLKNDLHDITYQAVNTPNEFDGVMQVADTKKVLKTRRSTQGFIEIFINRVSGMFSIQPIVGHIIALSLAMVTIFYIFNNIEAPWFVNHKIYFSIGLQLAAALSIIKSARRSLLLPFTALVVGGIIAHSLSHHHTLFHFTKSVYEHLMIVEVIGLIISIVSID